MRNRVSFALLGFVIVSVLIFLLASFGLFTPLQGFMQQHMSPIKQSLYSTKTSESPEIKRLKDENAKLLSKFVDYENIKKDNIALRSQYETENTNSYKLLPVHVIGVIGKYTNPEKLIINEGSSDGIKIGANVILGKNFIGIVTTVSPHVAHVMLPTNTAFTTLGKTLQDESLGVIHGAGDFIVLDNVVITDKLTKGDLLMTKGEIKNNNKSVLSDLIVGKIRSINKTETKPFQNAQIEPVVDYSRTSLVFVVL